MLVALEELKVILYRDGTFLFDGEVETAAAAAQKAIDHIVALKLGGQLVAGHTRLANDHDRGANLEAIADVKFVFHETLGGEVLAEHAPGSFTPGNSCRQNW